MHPYWAFLWALIALYSVVVNALENPAFRGWRAVWHFLSPLYVSFALALYFAIASVTWLRRFLDFGRSDTLSNPAALLNSLLQNHFAFAPYVYPIRRDTSVFDSGPLVPTVITLFLIMTLVWLFIWPQSRIRRLLPPALLLLVAVTSSLFFSYLSYRSRYIIFERQWLAGMALASVALTWLFAEWWRHSGRSTLRLALPALVYTALVVTAFVISLSSQVFITADRFHSWQDIKKDSRSIDELVAAAGLSESFRYEPASEMDGYGYLANLNAVRGGPVWEVFVAWLNKESGMRQEFRDIDQNWSTSLWPDRARQSGLCLPELAWQCDQNPVAQ